MKYAMLSVILLFCLSFKAHANRAMYVDDFSTILGDIEAEDVLLNYAQNNGIETLLLYDLHIINANYNLADPETNDILADFIFKAKNDFGIVKMGATVENGNFFENVIDRYNNSRNISDEKFDIYNLEFEFWNASATDPGGYYCTTYLMPNGLPCTNDGAFQYFISTLQIMKGLATNNIHPISIEAYLGWPTADQAASIGANLDRLRLHAYVTNPNTAFSYAENRLMDFANSNPELDISIIFSSEPEFMQDWLINNSINAAEATFTQDWIDASTAWDHNINLVGFTYFTYTYHTNIFLSNTSYLASETLKIYPNPVQNILSIENLQDIVNNSVYDTSGRLILKTKERKINFNTFPSGSYFLKILTEKGVQTKKIIKE